MPGCGRQHPTKPRLKCDRPQHLQRGDRQHSTLDPKNGGSLVEWPELPPAER